MMGPRLKTPALFLLLLGALTGTAFCEGGTTNKTRNGTSSPNSEVNTLPSPGNNNTTDALHTNTTQPEVPEESGSGEPDTSTFNFPITEKSEQDESDHVQLILIGAVVAGVIIGAVIIIGVVIWLRCSKKIGNQELTKEDPHLDGPSSEKVPMPMFEEDVPSVLELEMDELDQWMKKDS